MAQQFSIEGTASQQARASVLLARSAHWARGVDNHTGVAFVMFASSRTTKDGQPIYYKTRCDGYGCTCEGSRRYPVCSHQLAVRAEAEAAREAATVKPRVSLDALLDNHLVDAF